MLRAQVVEIEAAREPRVQAGLGNDFVWETTLFGNDFGKAEQATSPDAPFLPLIKEGIFFTFFSSLGLGLVIVLRKAGFELQPCCIVDNKVAS